MPGSRRTPTEVLQPFPLDVTGLSEQQRRGTICVYDGTALGSDAVDLGQRPHGQITVFPRACPRCTTTAAKAAIADHKAHCELCVEGDIPCAIRDALNVLTRGLRR